MEENYQQDNQEHQNLQNMAQQMEQQRIWYEYQFEPKKPRGNKGWIVLLIAAVIFIIVFLSLAHYL